MEPFKLNLRREVIDDNREHVRGNQGIKNAGVNNHLCSSALSVDRRAYRKTDRAVRRERRRWGNAASGGMIVICRGTEEELFCVVLLACI